MNRQTLLEATRREFDVAIVGAGVSGAAIYRELCSRGYRVLLVERGDFASGTSQASGMLIWGGLLYLRNLDVRTVWNLCRERDRLVREQPSRVETLRFRYLPLQHGGRSRRLVQAALYCYWMLGRRRRKRPYGENRFRSSLLVRSERFAPSLVYEEACVPDSDSRLVLSWIVSHVDEDHVALNHCGLDGAVWERGERTWRIELTDRLTTERWSARARILINAAGVSAERVCAACGLEPRYRHVLSKGVYLAFRKPAELDEALAFELGRHGDALTFTPWGPVALWGPTETTIENVALGARPEVDDLRFLLEHANANLREKRGAADVISLRCGIRPLAVERSFSRDVYPLDLSRRHLVVRDPNVAALTIFGGKITSAPLVAHEVAKCVRETFAPRGAPLRTTNRVMETGFRFPGVDVEWPSPRWCAEHESCATLEDYLRRRTNIAQWVPRMGLGRDDQNLPSIMAIAESIAAFSTGSETASTNAAEAVASWRREADRQDQLLATV